MKKIVKNNVKDNLDYSLHLGYSNYELPFELHFLIYTNWISFQNGAK
jgi:hypothetical protein